MSYIIKKMHGRTVPLAMILGLVFTVLLFGVLFNSRADKSHLADANTATASVTVLNMPPNWTVDAAENPASTTSSPTNVGQNVTFQATATDDTGDNYYLILCNNSATPTANVLAPPTCSGGAGNQYAVSVSTLSGSPATAIHAAVVGDPEMNVWFGWICDGNASGPMCNFSYRNGGTGPTGSPFNVNHAPSFTVFTNDSPALPNNEVYFNTVASDPDVGGTSDTSTLIVCMANDFTGTACGIGGTYCTSATSSFATNPWCVYRVPNPKPKGPYNVFPFVIDGHGFAASGGAQGVNVPYNVQNATPTITAASISLNGGGDMSLTQPAGKTYGFAAQWTVVDANSCMTSVSSNEITGYRLSVYRSGVAMASCMTDIAFNAANCYTSTSTGPDRWLITASQNAGSCLNQADSDAIWSASFTLWYVADPTDGTQVSDSPWWNQNWRLAVQAIDTSFATSTPVEGSTPVELLSFLSYDVPTNSISYGGFQPGNGNATTSQVVNNVANGNVGIDTTLYGTDMCVTYPACYLGTETSTIAVGRQHYSTTSTTLYANGVALLSNPGFTWLLHVPKSTATSTPQSKITYWGIFVPASISKAGDYTGVDTIQAVKSNALNW